MSVFTKPPKVTKVTTILEFDNGAVMTSEVTGGIYGVSFQVEHEKPERGVGLPERSPVVGVTCDVQGYDLILESKTTEAPG